MDAPAGFWKRYVAYFLDALILSVPVQLLSMGYFAVVGGSQLGPLLQLLQAAAQGDPAVLDPFALMARLLQLLARGLLVSTVLYVVLAAVYFIGFEATPRQGTPGKWALGLRVTDREGRPLSQARACGRFLAAIPSWLTLNLGHALAAWTREHRALHDYIAGTRVLVDPAHARMPAWAWVIVGLSVAASVALALLLVASLVLYLMATGAI